MQASTTTVRRRLERGILALAAAAGIAFALAGVSHAAIGEPAGAAWTPLAANEYFHVGFVSFAPVVPPARGDAPNQIAAATRYYGLSQHETWLAPDAHGFDLYVTGGSGDPTQYPRLYPDKHGEIHGWGPTLSGSLTPDQWDASLTYADSVNATHSTSDGRVAGTTWYRVPAGYRKGSTYGPFPLPAKAGTTPVERRQLESWYATSAQLDAVNSASDADVDNAVILLIRDDRTQSHSVWEQPGHYGVTTGSNLEEQHVRRAVELLSRAPLSARARGAIFAWLSHRPNVIATDTATDARGRTGTRLTFQTIRDLPIRARRVTLAQLKREGGYSPGVHVVGHSSYLVKRHHEYRRWYATVTFDTTSNELLEQQLYVRTEIDAMIPRIRRYSRAEGLRVALAMERQSTADAEVYDARDRTTTITPAAEVCHDHPGACR